MKRLSLTLSFAIGGVALGGSAYAQDLQQKMAAAQQAAAQNQQALRGYSWLETTKMSFKGEVKSTTVKQCRYGPDGKVQKTVVEAPPPPEQKRGLRGKVVEKKTEEIKTDVQSASALVHQYVPPDPGMMKAAMAGGRGSLGMAAPGAVALNFTSYLKDGDSMTLMFDQAVKALGQVSVDSWMDDPTNRVTLKVAFQGLPDGTRYPAVSTLGVPSAQVSIEISNSNYQKVAP
jgi:hypothetical protein